MDNELREPGEQVPNKETVIIVHNFAAPKGAEVTSCGDQAQPTRMTAGGGSLQGGDAAGILPCKGGPPNLL